MDEPRAPHAKCLVCWNVNAVRCGLCAGARGAAYNASPPRDRSIVSVKFFKTLTGIRNCSSICARECVKLCRAVVVFHGRFTPWSDFFHSRRALVIVSPFLAFQLRKSPGEASYI